MIFYDYNICTSYNAIIFLSKKGIQMTKEEFAKFDKDYEVCACMEVSLQEIQTAIKNGCDTVEKIMDETDAGTVCELCQNKDTDVDEDKELHLDEILEFSK